MKNKYLVFSIIVIIIYIVFFNFNVVYFATNSSPAGTRTLNIKYSVRWGKIHSCKGTYSYPSSMEQRLSGNWNNNIESCDVGKLINKKYNTPLELINYLNIFKMYKKVIDGPTMYQMKITWF